MVRNYSNVFGDNFFKNIIDNPELFPVNFTYGDKEYKGFNKDFSLLSKNVKCENQVETVLLEFLLENTLKISLKVKHYYSHGATEWTVYFKNVSSSNSKVLQNFYTKLTLLGKYPMVKGILGDHINQYRPYAFDPTLNVLEFSSLTGQTSHNNFPYFNVEHGDMGAMLAIGWAGTWNARFYSDGEKTTYTATAVNGLKLYLKPNEEIRSALFVYAPYAIRNEHYATNYWRDWFVKHNLPKFDASGKDVEPFSTLFTALDTGRPNSDGSISETYETYKPTYEKLFKKGIRFDFRWLDAGWYVAPDGKSAIPFSKDRDWWHTVGTWEEDPIKWPKGTLLESTEYFRKHGMRSLVWFEPERVTDVDNLVKNYGYKKEWAIEVPGRIGICNNIGDPECLKWTLDRITKFLKENKFEMYREDNNFKPKYLWEFLDKKEGENRKGITEIRNITAHYLMWDEIIKCTTSYGGCAFVDSCASGGGRNDLESLRRGLPLLRSDSDRKAIAHRLSMSSSLNKWLPFNGACSIGDNPSNTNAFAIGTTDKYTIRASYLPTMHVSTLQPAQNPDTDFELYRFALSEWRKVNPYLLKEFYCLTPWHKEIDYTKHGEIDTTDYTVHCYFNPETERGVILAFRETECTKDYYSLSLPFRKDDETYILTDEDTKEEITVNGITNLYFSAPRTARVLWVRKK